MGQLKGKIELFKKWLETMLDENNLPKYFWAKAVNTSCYVLNRILLRPILKNLPMSFGKTRNPTLDISKSLNANFLY